MKRTIAGYTAALSVMVLAAVGVRAAEAVSGFRGNGSGVFGSALSATERSADKNVIWKTKLAGWSNSSPAPSGDGASGFVGDFLLTNGAWGEESSKRVG